MAISQNKIATKTIGYNNTDALDPAASVFVSANAGAGKTSLLTSRVLRLLLHGVAPSRILCLTFTNAASAEMMSRVQKELGAWVMADDKKLDATLAALIGKTPDKHILARARGLFAQVLEAPEGVRIETIHGFCQSLLRRFPIEAGISPHFTVMDGRTEQELLGEARLRLFNRAQTQDAKLQQSIHAIARMQSEPAFHALLAELIQHKRRIRSLFSIPDGVNAAIGMVRELLHIPPGGTLQSLLDAHFMYDEKTLEQWRRIVRALRTGEPSEQKTAEGLVDWFANQPTRESRIGDYSKIFLTQKGEPRKKLFKKGSIVDLALIDTLLAEQERVWRFNDARKALEVAENTTHMLHLAEALLAIYDALKRARALMDYDDLILTACNLLERPGIAPWVLFKLDGGIDHILVDEAQDTSPEQWRIIDALTQEFFAGKGRKEEERSLFVVGDEKQSIYSFQGADPAALDGMKQYFSQRIRDSGRPVHTIPLVRSFRSTAEVLSAVDAVFAQATARAGLMSDDAAPTHTPTRLGYPGVVEVWPLIKPPEEEIFFSPGAQLARNIAQTIRGWLDDGVANAGDIMILVRNRTTLVDRLVRALKRQDIPVAGIDRMALSDNLAVQDLIALGQCILLPEDNLTLAALLKSPIFNLSEEALFDLAWNRGEKSVWENLSCVARSDSAGPHAVHKDPVQPHGSQDIKQAYELLTDLRAKADYVSPYELYSYVLETRGARRRFTGRMGEEYNDPIDEFLGQALLYERSHPPSLQGFLHWLNASDSEIKRDMEQSKNCVRIMTVHGAKGLQAPIVILPDTVELPKLKDSLLWHAKGAHPLPFWPVSSQSDDALCAGLRDDQRQAMMAEYRRLLYVALTRAEDRLYIFGATSREKAGDDCWYTLVKNGLAPLAVAFETPWGEGLRVGIPSPSGRGWRKAPGEGTHLSPLPEGEGIFTFLSTPPPFEPAPPQPLVPSRLSGDEPASASPLTANAVYQRGTLIHQLLQHLPEAPEAERGRVACAIASGYAQTMPQEIQDECIREALAVLNDAQCAFLFAEGSLAEVPVAGCVELHGKPVAVAGQIDRLHIGKNEVWIADFKSNRAPGKAIPTRYIRQMALYKALLKHIYPQKTIRCALVWTALAKIDLLDDAQLDESPASSYI